jgi:heptosyltransferase II
LRKKKIGLAVMLNPSKEFNWMSFAAGIPARLGYDRKSGFLLTHKIRDEKYLGDAHEIDYNLRLVAQVGAKTADRSLGPLRLDDAQAAEAIAGLQIGSGDFIALHPFTSDPVKQWPLENFRALAVKLLAGYKMNLVIVGGKEEMSRSAEYFSGLDARAVNLAGKTSLPQLAAVLKKARVLISGDSGPVHLACCVGTPVVALFRNDIPGKGPVRWGPVSKGSLVIAKNNLDDISTGEVCAKVEEALDKK